MRKTRKPSTGMENGCRELRLIFDLLVKNRQNTPEIQVITRKLDKVEVVR